ncbi:MAG: FeoA family protein [Planctomycetota bacterium]
MQTIPLTQLKRGQSATIHRADLDAEDATMLRAMGLRPEATLRVCRNGSTCIVAVGTGHACTCRIGLDRSLADRVLVQPHS